MQFKSMTAMLLAAASLAIPAAMNADEAPAKPERPAKRQSRGPGERGGMYMQRNPDMMTARLVMKELRTYQADPSEANYAALENALTEAMKKDTAMRKERLEKQLQELEKTQAERAASLLKKVKSGEFKFTPPAREGRGPRPEKNTNRERRGPRPEKTEK